MKSAGTRSLRAHAEGKAQACGLHRLAHHLEAERGLEAALDAVGREERELGVGDDGEGRVVCVEEALEALTRRLKHAHEMAALLEAWPLRKHLVHAQVAERAGGKAEEREPDGLVLERGQGDAAAAKVGHRE